MELAVTQKEIYVGIVGADTKASWAKVSHVPAINRPSRAARRGPLIMRSANRGTARTNRATNIDTSNEGRLRGGFPRFCIATRE
jgi:hypothetical protein